MDEDDIINITFYGSLEEMFEDLGRAMEQADSRVRPAQAEIKPGQYFINFRHGPDLPIFGEILDIGKMGYSQEDRREIEDMYAQPPMRFYRFTRCFSWACPDGEIGDTHLSDVDAIIDRELFKYYKDNGWQKPRGDYFE